jgi:hypothetical protein
MEEHRLVATLEEFILNPKRHAEAFDIVKELATEPCRQDKEHLLEKLLQGYGCTACLTCRARELIDPGIRKLWTARAIQLWNENFDSKAPCDYSATCPNRGKFVRALKAHPHIMARFCVQHVALETEIKAFLKQKLREQQGLRTI